MRYKIRNLLLSWFTVSSLFALNPIGFLLFGNISPMEVGKNWVTIQLFFPFYLLGFMIGMFTER